MRTPVRSAATISLLTAGTLLGVASGTATAAPTAPVSLYAPSALVLTIGEGESAATSTPKRAVTLSCAPTASGTHPDPQAACTELSAVNGDLGALQKPDPDQACPLNYSPVVVTATGVWDGKRVDFEHTFGNACFMNATSTSVFAF